MLALLLAAIGLVAGGWWLRGGAERAAVENPRAVEAGRGVDALRMLGAVLRTGSAAPERPSLSIEGQVLREDGTPAAGAIVLATLPTSDTPDPTRPPLVCGGGGCEILRPRPRAELFTQVVADGEGRFVLSATEASAALAVWAEQGEQQGVIAPVRAGVKGVVLRLRPGQRLHGTATSEDGAPIAGARVVAIHRQWGRGFEAISDARGNYQLGPMPVSDYAVVGAAPDFLYACVEAYLGQDGEREQLVLPRERSVQGLVLEGDAPAAGVRVELSDDPFQTIVTTGADGRFRFAGLPPGGYSVRAMKGSALAEMDVYVRRIGEGDVTLVLRGAGGVRGVVLGPEGVAISGAKVLVTDSLQTAWTDLAGRYAFAPLAEGEHRLEVEAPGFQAPAERAISIRSGETAQQDFSLRPSAKAAGRIVNGAGVGVAGASITAWSGHCPHRASDRWVAGAVRADSDADGEGGFQLDGLPPGTACLQARAPRALWSQREVQLPAIDLRLVSDSGARFTVKVLDARGEPLLGAGVTLGTEPGRDQWDVKGETDAQGRCVLEGLPTGRFTLDVAFPGAPRRNLSVTLPVDVAADSTGAVTVRHPGALLAIAGHVVDHEGRPIEGAEVDASREESSPSVGTQSTSASGRSWSGMDGSFQIDGLAPGVYLLRLSAPGHRSSALPVIVEGVAEVGVVLDRYRRITGRVVRPGGEPVERFELNGRPFVDADGRFALDDEDIRGNPLDLEWVAEGLGPARMTVPPDKRPVVSVGDVVLSPGRRIEGRAFAAATGAPLPNLAIALLEPTTARELDQCRTGGDGRFAFPHASADVVVVTVANAGLRADDLLVPPETSRSLSLIVHPAAFLEVEVQGDAGRPGNRNIRLSRSGVAIKTHRISGSLFQAGSLEPGEYLLEVEGAPEYAPKRLQLTEESRLRIELRPDGKP